MKLTIKEAKEIIDLANKLCLPSNHERAALYADSDEEFLNIIRPLIVKKRLDTS